MTRASSPDEEIDTTSALVNGSIIDSGLSARVEYSRTWPPSQAAE